MQRVVHVSVAGNAFTLEEGGHAALQAYLDEAARRLAVDPDKEEILGDLEQAIAEKCARCVGPAKDVVTAAEVERVIAEMGPVSAPPPPGEGTPPPSDAAAEPAAPTEPPPRRLYRILEEGVLGGLCAGIGAYLRLDANVVRAGFVILALVTHGAWLLVYLVLLFVIPAAGTAEERAAARGLPFSAQELIDQAKRQVARLERGLRGPWAKARAEWRRERAEWRRQRKERREWREWRDAWRPPPAAGAQPPATYGEQVAAGVVVPFLAMFSAALTVAWAVASARLVAAGDLWGWNPGVPLWGGLVLLLVAVAVVGGPVRHARHALHRDAWGRGALLAAWDGLLWLGFVALFAWLAWRLSPELRALVHDLPGAAAKVRASLPSSAR